MLLGTKCVWKLQYSSGWLWCWWENCIDFFSENEHGAMLSLGFRLCNITEFLSSWFECSSSLNFSEYIIFWVSSCKIGPYVYVFGEVSDGNGGGDQNGFPTSRVSGQCPNENLSLLLFPWRPFRHWVSLIDFRAITRLRRSRVWTNWNSYRWWTCPTIGSAASTA